MEGLNNYNMFDDVEQNDSYNNDCTNDVPAGLELKDSMEIEVADVYTTMHEPVNTRPPLALATPAAHQIPPPLESLTLDKAIEYEIQSNHGSDPNVDLKKLRRTVSNRLSAKRSRIRKNKHMENMEKNIDELQKVIANLTKEIEDYEENNKMLVEENASLQALLDRRTEEAKLADGKIESCKEEIRWLKGLASQKNVIEDREADKASCSKEQDDDNEDDDISQYFNWDELTNGDDHTDDIA